MSKPSFPKDFHWGYATASAQVEGSIHEGGKGESIWDKFSSDPSHTEDGGSTVTGTGFYEKYQEDVDMMKSYGGSLFAATRRKQISHLPIVERKKSNHAS
jgi:beta-glucosidase